MRAVLRYPTKPTPGDAVAVLSPGAALPALFPAPFDLGLTRLQERYGLVPVEYPTTREWSSPQARAADVMAAFADPRIAAVLTSIGGSDQIKILRHLDPEVLRANPKPFFGLSDNTNLCCYLWRLGIVSYQGGTVMTTLGRPGNLNPHSAESLERALFSHDWYRLRPAETFTDMGKDWNEPDSLTAEPEMLPGSGWSWHGPSSPVEGTLWGGCLEIIDVQVRVSRYLPSDEALDGCVLYLETSEEMPTAQYVGEVLMCLGERGLLQRFAALIMARPKAWTFEDPRTPEGRAAYVDAQREVVLTTWQEYRPDAPVVFDVDFGHTDPQLVVPNGGQVRLDPAEGTIDVLY